MKGLHHQGIKIKELENYSFWKDIYVRKLKFLPKTQYFWFDAVHFTFKHISNFNKASNLFNNLHEKYINTIINSSLKNKIEIIPKFFL